jgi:hypothetical protein
MSNLADLRHGIVGYAQPSFYRRPARISFQSGRANIEACPTKVRQKIFNLCVFGSDATHSGASYAFGVLAVIV